MSRGSVILLYHRLKTVTTNPNHLCVSPQHFREHLEVLSKDYRVVPLQQLVRASPQKRSSKSRIALTIDDGYGCNWDVAYPLLKEFGLPATFFITTGQIDRHRDYWWDELERLVTAKFLPNHLLLRVKSEAHEWHSDGDWDSQAPQWAMGLRRSLPKSRREELFRDLLNLLTTVPEAERLDFQDQLLSWAGLPIASLNPVLSQEQISRLAATGFIEIGANSVSHPILTQLTFGQQLDEIRQSKRWLERIRGSLTTSFSYPHGRFNDESLQAARAAGLKIACTCDIGKIGPRTDPLLMPPWK